MTPAELSRVVLRTVRHAVASGELRAPVPERVTVQRPPRPGCGDYATNVALRLAGPAGQPAHRVAEILRRTLAAEPGIAGVEIAGPGFLNITLDTRSHGGVVREILARGDRYGHGDGLAASRVTLVHDGEPRAAAVAEAATRLLAACGARPGPPETVTAHPVGVTKDESRRRLGEDAAQWAVLRPPAEDTPRTDPAELLSQREDNPLFRIRYAHARTRALLRNAHDLGVPVTDGDLHGEPAETELLGRLADYPRVVEAAALQRAPDRVARHLEHIAGAFFRFHDECPVLPRGDEKPSVVHGPRLRLADATGTVLANGLHLLGISAPEHL